ncbi:MAG: hypothetical protein IT204_24335 [Fimbriimonadaceae bacterium]|nr:hypothetical protein [Fimbriimonadaceae bacterium]
MPALQRWRFAALWCWWLILRPGWAAAPPPSFPARWPAALRATWDSELAHNSGVVRGTRQELSRPRQQLGDRTRPPGTWVQLSIGQGWVVEAVRDPLTGNDFFWERQPGRARLQTAHSGGRPPQWDQGRLDLLLPPYRPAPQRFELLYQHRRDGLSLLRTDTAPDWRRSWLLLPDRQADAQVPSTAALARQNAAIVARIGRRESSSGPLGAPWVAPLLQVDRPTVEWPEVALAHGLCRAFGQRADYYRQVVVRAVGPNRLEAVFRAAVKGGTDDCHLVCDTAHGGRPVALWQQLSSPRLPQPMTTWRLDWVYHAGPPAGPRLTYRRYSSAQGAREVVAGVTYETREDLAQEVPPLACAQLAMPVGSRVMDRRFRPPLEYTVHDQLLTDRELFAYDADRQALQQREHRILTGRRPDPAPVRGWPGRVWLATIGVALLALGILGRRRRSASTGGQP